MEAWRHTWADNDDESDGVHAKMDDEDGCWEDFPHARRSERLADKVAGVVSLAPGRPTNRFAGVGMPGTTCISMDLHAFRGSRKFANE